MTIREKLLSLPRIAKRGVVLIIDGSLCVFSVWVSLYLRLGEFIPLSQSFKLVIIVSLTLALPILTMSGLYRAVFRYSGWSALMTVAKAIAIYGLLFFLIFTVYGFEGVPRTIGIIQPIVLFLLIGLSRAIAYYWLGGEYKRRIGALAKERVLIYGAGSAGRQIAAALSSQRTIKVVGFLDDEKSLTGQVLNGLTIYDPKDLSNIAANRAVTSILLALPSVNRTRRQEIINQIKTIGILVRTLPSVSDIAQGRISINDIKDLDIDDLLNRQPIDANPELIKKTIKSQRVLVTGAGGSIGSEISRQIIRQSPASIILVDHSEYALYKIDEEIRSYCTKYAQDQIKIISILLSIKDFDALECIFDSQRPETVFHAAAYKHVTLVEENIVEGIKNNIIGTKNVAELSYKFKVKNFVLISTDKAVRSTNVMGATKRWAELIIQNMSAKTKEENLNQKFSAVRFGNVLGSSGSVVPLFKEQIKSGGPITLTHPDVTRYFMSISEATSLVLQAASIAEGGEIFLLDMGQPVRIIDLARNMIQLSGLTIKEENNPRGDIEIEIIGLRPGEKLHEELLISDNVHNTIHPKIMKAIEPSKTSLEISNNLNLIERIITNKKIDVSRLKEILFE